MCQKPCHFFIGCFGGAFYRKKPIKNKQFHSVNAKQPGDSTRANSESKKKLTVAGLLNLKHLCFLVVARESSFVNATMRYNTPSFFAEVLTTGVIKSDAGVQGLPCDGMCGQGKPCTQYVISNTAQLSLHHV